MRQNRLKKTLDDGNVALGLVHFSGSPSVISVMGAAGLDWVTIDTEHACNDVSRVQQLILAADAAGITPVVRVPHVDPWIIGQLLDEGAGGIMISHIGSKEQAMEAVRAVKYPPLGERGACGQIRAAGYDPPNWREYAEQANREVLLFLLIEEKSGYDDIDEILAVPGVDVAFLGRVDFALSIGLPGETRWDHPVMSAMADKVLAAAKKHGVYVQVSMGQPFEDPEYMQAVLKRGFKLIACGSDMLMLARGCKQLTSLRGEIARVTA
jgi:2-keto-3-deoxy-L-rhamnonate aldolase RhmA